MQMHLALRQRGAAPGEETFSARLEPGGPLKIASQRLDRVRVAAAYFIAVLSSLTTAFAMPRLPCSLSMLLHRD